MLTSHPGLRTTSRLQNWVCDHQAAPAADWMLLMVFGAFAAICSACLDIGLQRIPGHAILRVVFPLAVGLAIVPRHQAGTVMAGSAFVTSLVLWLSGIRSEALGIGALTSLLTIGPLLDLTLQKANNGWKQYAAFAVAGLGSNLLALLVRGAAKATGFEAAGRRPLGEWLAQAAWTYAACGLLAGILSAPILFRSRRHFCQK